MRRITAVLILLVVVLIVPALSIGAVGVVGSVGHGAAADSDHRRVPAGGWPAAVRRRDRHAVGLRGAPMAGCRCGRSSRPWRSRRPQAASRCCSARATRPAFRPRCLRSGDGQWMSLLFERAGEAGAAARADCERAVCAEGVGCGDARRAAGLGVSARADGGSRERQPRDLVGDVGGGARRGPAWRRCCRGRRIFSRST